ncbi:uncharacterized protein C9orf57 homolog [Cynocephalus volans]|uniref:uncharacterized protein C9orf57 homolog n=1 Tax=Cynocephalus volans TaxID=110931 RepID=UPI002FCB42BC
MKRVVFADAFILFCLLGGVGGVICRACNLSVPFHGCLLDFGTCRAKPGQYCIKEVHTKGGIQWYSVKGCTENEAECFKRTLEDQLSSLIFPKARGSSRHRLKQESEEMRMEKR